MYQYHLKQNQINQMKQKKLFDLLKKLFFKKIEKVNFLFLNFFHGLRAPPP